MLRCTESECTTRSKCYIVPLSRVVHPDPVPRGTGAIEKNYVTNDVAIGGGDAEGEAMYRSHSPESKMYRHRFFYLIPHSPFSILPHLISPVGFRSTAVVLIAQRVGATRAPPPPQRAPSQRSACGCATCRSPGVLLPGDRHAPTSSVCSCLVTGMQVRRRATPPWPSPHPFLSLSCLDLRRLAEEQR